MMESSLFAVPGGAVVLGVAALDLAFVAILTARATRTARLLLEIVAEGLDAGSRGGATRGASTGRRSGQWHTGDIRTGVHPVTKGPTAEALLVSGLAELADG